MTFIEIPTPPENASEYTKVSACEVRDEFIRELAALLDKKTDLICTEPVPIDWITSAFYSSHFDGHNPYRVFVVRAPANFGAKGAAVGYFFIERQKPKEN